MSFYTVGNKDLKIILLKLVFWMSRNIYFAQKEALRKEGCFSRNEDFHRKGTFYHITTAY